MKFFKLMIIWTLVSIGVKIFAEELPLLPGGGKIEFGPFFIPDSRDLSGVYLIYYTQLAQETKVQFSIMGEMDWARSDYTPTHQHIMRFSSMEEGMQYRFELLGNFFQIQALSGVKTPPYGNTYRLNFSIADISQVDKVKEPGEVIFLTAPSDKISLSEWQKTIRSNPDLFANIITIPLFEIESDALPVKLNSLEYFQYRDARIILIKSDKVEPMQVLSLLDTDPDKHNYLVFNGPVSQKKVADILLQCQGNIDSAFSRNSMEHYKHQYLENFVTIHVVRDAKKKFALK